MSTIIEDKKTTGNPQAANKSGPPKSDSEKAEMKKNAEIAGTPGPAHKLLQTLAGNWKAEVKCWMEPGGAPQVTEGTAKASLTFNGRFLDEEFHGQMGGKPFVGRTLLGFDNAKQTFNSVWISDAQTSMFTTEGKGDNDNKVITMEGKASCPATGQKNMTMKTVLRLISPDKHVFEMIDATNGGNAKTMEITYTRQ